MLTKDIKLNKKDNNGAIYAQRSRQAQEQAKRANRLLSIISQVKTTK